MAYPIPGVGIGTPYGRRGSHWGCNKDSSGRGLHTGCDFPAKAGTKIFAPIAGQIRHRSYGSAFGKHQFAISPDADQPFGKGEVFFAHCRTRLADGVRVEVGDFIAEVGAEGNVTGPHLHMEYMPSTKNQWRCGIHANPQPVLDHGGNVGTAGPYVTKDIYSDKLGYGEPTNGDDSSDTVKELQERLNRISLAGGRTLPVTGKYADMTDAEVRKWQEQIVKDKPDPAGQSFLGPAQRAALFPSPPYVIHDRGLPAIASGGVAPEPEPDPFAPKDGTTLGRWLADIGFPVNDQGVSVGRASTWLGPRFIMWHHTAGAEGATPDAEAKWIRTGNGDAPLAQIMVDRDGKTWLCSYERDGQPDPGRASHAGAGSGFGVPNDRMNEVSVGIEFQSTGKEPIISNHTQYRVGIWLTALLCYRWKIDPANVIGHKEWSSTGKQDPLDDMDTVRSHVRQALGMDKPVEPPPVEPPPEPEPDPEPEPPVSGPLFQYHYSGKPSGVQAVGTSYVAVDKSSYTPPGDGFLLSMLYINCQHTFDSGVNEAGFRVRSVRAAWNGQGVDYSGYGDFVPNRNLTKSGEFLLTHLWFEKCDGGRKVHWEVDRASQFGKFELGTRYTKWVWLSKDVFALLSRALGGEKRAVTFLEEWLADADEESTFTL